MEAIIARRDASARRNDIARTALRAARVGRCCSTTRRSRATATRCGSSAPSSGSPYETVEVDVVDRSNRQELLGDLNPALRVPTVVLDDGRPLAESSAIIWYLAEGSPLVPDDPYERAQVLQWMFFEQYVLEPTIAVVRFWVAFSGRADEFADQIPAKMTGRLRRAGRARARARGREFLVGDRYTLADVALYAYTHVAHEGGFDLSGYPAINAWLAVVAAQPGPRPDRRL